MTAPGLIASNLRRIDKNTLIGVVDLEVPAWRLKFKGCLWHRKRDKEWLHFPGREWIDRQGNQQFADLVELTDRDIRDRFQSAALRAGLELAEGSP
jgi:hypothetical protein